MVRPRREVGRAQRYNVEVAPCRDWRPPFAPQRRTRAAATGQCVCVLTTRPSHSVVSPAAHSSAGDAYLRAFDCGQCSPWAGGTSRMVST
jgi:hypothetical protein